jgi:ABC-type Fe3+-hydroxamate transport system substrate-binding protein
LVAEVTDPAAGPRIASLVPSLTETLVELGLRPWLVARTGFCTQPRDALRDVPKVGGTKDVDLARLRRLAPTHVIVNVDENRLDTVEALRAFIPRVMVTHPCTPHDNLGLLDLLGNEFAALPGVAGRLRHWRAELLKALAPFERAPGDSSATAARAPVRRVLYLIWREPWMTVARDTYISRLLALAGWQTLPDLEGGPRGAARYPVVAGDEPWLDAVDEVLLSSEPYPFTAAHIAHAQRLVPHARVLRVDGQALSWYGVRAVAGLRYLQQLARGDSAGAP